MCWILVDESLATDLRPTAKHVLMVLSHRAKQNTGHCYPSVSRIAKDTGLCRRAVQDAIKELDKFGHITRIEVVGKGVDYYVHPQTVNDSSSASDAPHPCVTIAGPVHETHLTGASRAPKPKPTIIETSYNQEFQDAVHQILDLVGWRRSQKNFARARERLSFWLDAGFDLKADVLSGIAEAIAERPGHTNSMKRFDIPIRRAQSARKGGQGAHIYRNAIDKPKSIGTHAAELMRNLQIHQTSVSPANN